MTPLHLVVRARVFIIFDQRVGVQPSFRFFLIPEVIRLCMILLALVRLCVREGEGGGGGGGWRRGRKNECVCVCVCVECE
jgi:hypothetical protein